MYDRVHFVPLVAITFVGKQETGQPHTTPQLNRSPNVLQTTDTATQEC